MLNSRGPSFSTTNQSRWAPASKPNTTNSTPYSNHYSNVTRPEVPSVPTGNTSYGSMSSLSDPALQQIDEVANSMDLDSEEELKGYNSPGSSIGHVSIVLDTNVLLGQLDVMQQFAEDVANAGESISITIPGVVVQELDYQKSDRSRDLGWPARMASTWILSKLKEKKVVRGQAYQETLQTSGSWKKRDPDTSNDDLIVDCCLFLRDKKGHYVLAISRDHNLCSLAESQGLRTLNPKDYHRWSSRVLARTIFGDACPEARLRNFSTFRETFRSRRLRQALDDELGAQPSLLVMDDDGMDVDDGFVTEIEPPPQHLLDDLHDQVVLHFTILLKDLLRRVSPSLLTQKSANAGAAASIYAPSIASKPARDWTARDILKYLCDMRRFPPGTSRADKESILQNASRLINFLTHKYDKQGSGRSGQHWSRADWVSCLDTLKTVGKIYGDEAIRNSLAQLDPQVTLLFETPMRPTGVGSF